MGEDVTVGEGEGGGAFVRHHHCPWFHWHKRRGLLDEDQSGCDTWFRTVVAGLNKGFASDIKVETQCSLPAGGDCCLRRTWVWARTRLGWPDLSAFSPKTGAQVFTRGWAGNDWLIVLSYVRLASRACGAIARGPCKENSRVFSTLSIDRIGRET